MDNFGKIFSLSIVNENFREKTTIFAYFGSILANFDYFLSLLKTKFAFLDFFSHLLSHTAFQNLILIRLGASKNRLVLQHSSTYPTNFVVGTHKLARFGDFSIAWYSIVNSLSITRLDFVFEFAPKNALQRAPAVSTK